MTRQRARYIPELLQIHAQDLAFVWGQRRHALTSAEHTQRDYAALGERLEAHLQGLLCAPPADLLALMAPGLISPDADESFAAGYALLRSGQAQAATTVLTAFEQAADATLQGLREALAAASPALTTDRLREVLQHAPPATAAAAAAVLASHRQLPRASLRLGDLLEDADGETAALAWRAALLADRQGRPVGENTPTRPYWLALSHADPQVRDAGWSAVAWAGQISARPTLRKLALDGDAVAQRWLATLGVAEDVPPLQRCALQVQDGPQRCALLARHGHPGGLNALVRWMDDPDEATMVAAGLAFEQLTGIDVRGQRREMTAAAGADEFERAMMPLAWFPDAEKARSALAQRQSEWTAGQRWRRGLCVDPSPDAQAERQLDMQTRWDIAARHAMAGGDAPPPPLA